MRLSVLFINVLIVYLARKLCLQAERLETVIDLILVIKELTVDCDCINNGCQLTINVLTVNYNCVNVSFHLIDDKLNS